MKSVGILICTVDRPNMLKNCLLSIINQTVDSGIQVEILVVENDVVAKSRTIVDEVRQGSPFPLHYVQEHKRSIPFVRNRSLNEALLHGYDWIVLIDDDEIAFKGWLSYSPNLGQYLG